MPLISLTPIRKNRKFQSGYDCDFLQAPPPLVQTECTVCLLIFRQPQLVSCCGHNYCKNCIRRLMEDNQPCPLCKSKNFTVLHNQDLERALAQLEVRCVYSKLGCEWTGELGSYNHHLNLSTEKEEEEGQLQGCKYVELECSYKCGSWFRRGALARHLSEKCPQRPFCCDYCGEYTSIHADVIFRHWPVCRSYPVSCPNNCTAYAIERQHLEDHLRLDCPLKPIECEFHGAGCEELVPRAEMTDHLEEWHVQHTSMLAQAHQKLQDDLEDKEELMAIMKKSSAEELVRVKEDGQRQIDSLWVENSNLKNQLALMERQMEEMKAQFSSLSRIYELAQSQTEEQQVNNVKTLSADVAKLKSDFSEFTVSQSQQVYSVQASVGVFPLDIIMPNVSHHLDTRKEWQSRPFHSHLQGYRLCLVVSPGVAQEAHLAVHACLMRGKYDDQLKWPFHAEILLQLRNVLTDRYHATSTIRFTDKTPTRFTSQVEATPLGSDEDKRTGEGWGLKSFIRPSDLGYNAVKNRQHLKDNQLHFRIIKITLTN